MSSSGSSSSSSASSNSSSATGGFNLKKELARRILSEVIYKGKGKDAGVVLVVDPHTSKLLSSCLRMHDLLSAGVLVLENLSLTRERLPDLPAIYFVEPTEEALEIIIQDFPKPPPAPPAPPNKGILSSISSALGLSKPPPVAATPVAPVKKPHYASAHLFFTCTVPQARMKQLQNSDIDMKRIKGFVELGIDFIAFESRVFLFDEPHWIPRLYLGEELEDGPKNSVLMPAVRQLCSLLITLLPPGEMPYIRYISEELNIGKTFISQQFAQLVDREMNKHIKSLSVDGDSKPASAATTPTASATPSASSASSSSAAISSNTPKNTTVLIVDRSLDPLTPLMHEFTFQAMVNDLLNVKGEIVFLPTAQKKEGDKSTDPSPSATLTPAGKEALQKQLQERKEGTSKTPQQQTDNATSGEVVLSEDDPLWVEYRHKHIGEVMVNVNKQLKEFASSNKMAQFQHMLGSKGENKKDGVKDMLKAVSEMPEYKQAMKRYAKHVHLSEECLLKFQQKLLQQIGELEQCMATNTDVEGKIYINNKEVKEKLKALVGDRATSKPISLLDKLRLIAIYAIVQGGIPEALFKILSVHIHPRLLRCIIGQNMADLGVEIDSFESQLSRARIEELISRNQSQNLALMRYVPSLKSIMEGLVENALSVEQFPYTKSGKRLTAEEEKAVSSGKGGTLPNGSSSSSLVNGKEFSKLSKKELEKMDPEARARLKILADAEKDKAHHATGRSARRRTSEKMRDSEAKHLAASSSSASESNEALKEKGSKPEEEADLPSGPPPHRYIVFMLGGLCYSEMRACYEVADGTAKPLIIGSTAALTPAEFLLDVSGLTRKEFYKRLADSASQSLANQNSNSGDSSSTKKHHLAPSASSMPPKSSPSKGKDNYVEDKKGGMAKSSSTKTLPNSSSSPAAPASASNKKKPLPARDAMSSSESDEEFTDSSDESD